MSSKFVDDPYFVGSKARSLLDTLNERVGGDGGPLDDDVDDLEQHTLPSFIARDVHEHLPPLPEPSRESLPEAEPDLEGGFSLRAERPEGLKKEPVHSLDDVEKRNIPKWLFFTRPYSRKNLSWQAKAAVFVLYWGAVCGIWLALILGGLVTTYSYIAEDPLKAGLSQKPAKLTILAVGGKVIAEKGLRRNHVKLEDMPAHMVQAVLSTEDRWFFYHFGFDPMGILRAGIANYRAGRIVQGGSTITQQLVKVLFLKPERTYWRKIEEVLLSLSLEFRLEKKQILELYLNRIYFGAGNYGIEAATQHYFGKPVGKIGIYEAAILAGLIKSPSYYAPTRDFQRSLDRGHVVLQTMLRDEGITFEAYNEALLKPPTLRAYLPSESYGYILDLVTQRVAAFGQNLQEDMVVETTIDYDLQGTAQRLVRESLQVHGKKYLAGEAAAVILDQKGAVKALVGGRDYTKSPFNRAIQSRRQPGSTFKPFVYLAALEKGLTPESLVHDGPVQIGNWSPRNYNNRYYGDVTMRRGLAQSLNTVSVRLTEWVGRDTVIKTAHRLGINSKIKNNPSLALGSSEVSLMELTSAYVPFANGGFAMQPHVIKEIRNAKGEVLFKVGTSNWGRVIRPQHVAAMNDMLSATIKAGTGKKAALEAHPAGGKTGTGQDYRDAWFIGYTAHYVTGVWVGNDDFSPMKRATGGGLPSMIWHDLMDYAHRDKPPTPLPGHDPGQQVDGNWQEAVAWSSGEKKKSFWETLFGGSSLPDSRLGTPSASLPPGTVSAARRKTNDSPWPANVFSRN